jgi:hypothetical protein
MVGAAGFTLADPGVLTVLPGDTVQFVNGIGRKMLLYFPETELFEELADLGRVVEVPKDGTKLRVAGRLKQQKAYQYAMWSGATRSFAIGGSNPKIIIGSS